MHFAQLESADGKKRVLILALDENELKPEPRDSRSAYHHLRLGSHEWFPDVPDLSHEHLILTTAPALAIRDELYTIFANILELDLNTESIRILPLTPDITSRLRRSALESHTWELQPPLPTVTVLVGGKREFDEWMNANVTYPDEKKQVAEPAGWPSHSPRYFDWLSTLPFPLASALRLHDTLGDRPLNQLYQCAYTLEAFAQFLATIHLSAFARSELWAELRNTYNEALRQAGSSLHTPTFGTWVTTAGFFASKARQLYNDPAQRDAIHRMFGVANEGVLTMLTSRTVIGALQNANHLRNTLIAHGAMVDDEGARAAHGQFAVHMQTVVNVFGWNWEHYVLVLPREMRMPTQNVYRCSISRLSGAAGPFGRHNVELAHPLQEGYLYMGILDAAGGPPRSLMQLLPFVRVDANAGPYICSFFNRRVGERFRFVSHHAEYTADIITDQPDVLETLRLIAGGDG